jgi:hypothetical protein
MAQMKCAGRDHSVCEASIAELKHTLEAMPCYGKPAASKCLRRHVRPAGMTDGSKPA